MTCTADKDTFGSRTGRSLVNSRNVPIIAGLIFIALLTVYLYVMIDSLPDEDAYITYIYPQSLLRGDGLTYHGVRVEGYTNLLTVLLVALVAGVTSLSPAVSGFLLSASLLGLSFASLFLIIVTSLRDRLTVWQGTSIGLATILAIALTPYALYWGFSGMENSLLTWVVLSAVLAYLADHRRIALGLAAIIPLVRYDGVLLTAVLVLFYCLDRIITEKLYLSRGLLLKSSLKLLGVCAIVAIPFLLSVLFRVAYYGSFAPNTSYMKFFGRSISDRFYEGLVYAWNSLWSSKVLLLLLIIFLGMCTKAFIWKRATILIGILLVISVLQMILVGGDVAWKPYARFGYLTNMLGPLLFMISFTAKQIRRYTFLAVTLFALGVFLQSPLQPVRATYAHQFVSSYHFEPNPVFRAAIQFGSFSSLASAQVQSLAGDFPEDVLAVTGKYLRWVAEPSAGLITSAAGKVVYYSGLRTIDVSGLADVAWREGTFEQRMALAQQATFLVVHTNDSYCQYRPYLDSNPPYRLVAIIYSPERYGGLYMYVYANRAGLLRPDSLGERTLFARHPVHLAGQLIDYYTDRFDPAVDLAALDATYANWINCTN